ncbi:hypothetical protein Pen01_66470 [Phytomonospora endophytica]|nr:hypothetical protein Pen01_66470 [Phytomonospora endophytica]
MDVVGADGVEYGIEEGSIGMVGDGAGVFLSHSRMLTIYRRHSQASGHEKAAPAKAEADEVPAVQARTSV